MGKLDDNDAVPYEDAFDQKEKEQIFRLLGEEMQPSRWENCKKNYMIADVNARVITYDHIGHEHPEEIKKEIIEFFKECINKNKQQ